MINKIITVLSRDKDEQSIILGGNDEKGKNIRITARLSKTLKNVKAKILVEVRRRGIMCYNSWLVMVVGMNKGQCVRDLDKKVVLAYQVFCKDKITFCHFNINLTNRSTLLLKLMIISCKFLAACVDMTRTMRRRSVYLVDRKNVLLSLCKICLVSVLSQLTFKNLLNLSES